MHLQTEIFGDVVVVHTPEELGAEQCDAFETCVRSFERKRVVLDADSTELIDSKGLAALLNVQDMLRDVGGEVKIATTNTNNRKIFEMTRLYQHIDVFDGVVDAVKSFQ
jgi:anti-sigma B factor antagonist